MPEYGMCGERTCGMFARAHICGFMVSSPTRMKVESSEMFDIINANCREEIFARSFRLYLQASATAERAREGRGAQKPSACVLPRMQLGNHRIRYQAASTW